MTMIQPWSWLSAFSLGRIYLIRGWWVAPGVHSCGTLKQSAVSTVQRLVWRAYIDDWAKTRTCIQLFLICQQKGVSWQVFHPVHVLQHQLSLKLSTCSPQHSLLTTSPSRSANTVSDWRRNFGNLWVSRQDILCRKTTATQEILQPLHTRYYYVADNA